MGGGEGGPGKAAGSQPQADPPTPALRKALVGIPKVAAGPSRGSWGQCATDGKADGVGRGVGLVVRRERHHGRTWIAGRVEGGTR